MKTIVAGFLIVFGAYAQQKEDTRSPDVFLDNHRPLNPKKEKAATSRTVTGQVVDDSGQPLEGALVTLINDKTKEKHDYFTKKDGRYKFEDLNFTVDYQLRAKWKALVSEERKLSQYDHAARIVRMLEVTTPEGAPPPQPKSGAESPAQAEGPPHKR
jgi:hypothetical protein